MDSMKLAKRKIIFAADVNSLMDLNDCLMFIDKSIGMVKIGKQLFTKGGIDAVRLVQSRGLDVFLDLKYHDIPNTVAMAGLEAARLGVKMFNVHALGGLEMMEKLVFDMEKEFPRGYSGRPIMLAVTILTSSNEETLKKIGIEYSVPDMVVRLAKLAQDAGMDGVVASPKEIGLIREACGPDFLIVTPGVRPEWALVNDQKRVMTPGEAITAGADYLVIGRPISAHNDPALAARMIFNEVETALEMK